MQVVWPECSWQPVSLTDLITAAAVKKVYRKATLCLHPDKVQQKGANLQQKYIAEKVFDLLKVLICFSVVFVAKSIHVNPFGPQKLMLIAVIILVFYLFLRL